MSGKTISITPLAVRKQLLLAESELNRARLTAQMTAVTSSVRSLADRTRHIRSVTASAAGLFAGLAVFQRSKQSIAAVKSSRIDSLLKCAGLISSLWLACRKRPGVTEQ